MVIGDKIYNAQKYDAVIVPPFTLHKIGGSFSERILVFLNKQMLAKYYTPAAAEKLFGCLNAGIITLAKDDHDKIIDMLYKYGESGQNESKTAFAHIGEMLAVLNENIEKGTAAESDRGSIYNKTVLAVMEYINDQYGSIKNIEQIAERFYITKYHLCRIFKEQTGATIIEYLNGVRVSKACAMLSGTNESITDICFACGFNSSMYFSRLFKSYTLYSPSEYRKNVHEMNMKKG